MVKELKALLARRSWMMNLLLGFCAYMTFLYMPFDMFLKPMAEDQEVWFGILLTGFWAKATEPFHWLIYAAGYYGFLHMKPWMSPWAALYVGQIAIGMLVWNLTDERGGGWPAGLISGAVFAVLAVWLWLARDQFTDLERQPSEEE